MKTATCLDILPAISTDNGFVSRGKRLTADAFLTVVATFTTL